MKSVIVYAYLEVPDLERAAEFYTAAIGLRRRLDSDRVEPSSWKAQTCRFLCFRIGLQ